MYTAAEDLGILEGWLRCAPGGLSHWPADGGLTASALHHIWSTHRRVTRCCTVAHLQWCTACPCGLMHQRHHSAAAVVCPATLAESAFESTFVHEHLFFRNASGARS